MENVLLTILGIALLIGLIILPLACIIKACIVYLLKKNKTIKDKQNDENNDK